APLLDDLRAAAIPTLVVVTGDHGEALGDHGEQSHGLFAYESTLRVPLIVAELSADRARNAQSSPNDRGSVATRPVRPIDILPTSLAGMGLPSHALPGRSLLTAADREDAAPGPSYFEAMSAMLNRGWAPLAGVIVARDKYIDLPIAERYDLASDAREQSN